MRNAPIVTVMIYRKDLGRLGPEMLPMEQSAKRGHSPQLASGQGRRRDLP